MMNAVQSQNHLLAERRLIALMDTMGDNLREYGRDWSQTYIVEPWKSNDPVQVIIGGVGAAASAVLEGTDVLWSGLVDEKYEPPDGMAGRITRDVRLLVTNIGTFHPLRAVGNLWRLATSDIPLTFIDVAGGFHESSSATRSQIHSLTEYPRVFATSGG
jgi:hypothetical protein